MNLCESVTAGKDAGSSDRQGSLSKRAGRPKDVFQCHITVPLSTSTHTLINKAAEQCKPKVSKNCLPHIKACAEEGKI